GACSDSAEWLTQSPCGLAAIRSSQSGPARPAVVLSTAARSATNVRVGRQPGLSTLFFPTCRSLTRRRVDVLAPVDDNVGKAGIVHRLQDMAERRGVT